MLDSINQLIVLFFCQKCGGDEKLSQLLQAHNNEQEKWQSQKGLKRSQK